MNPTSACPDRDSLLSLALNETGSELDQHLQECPQCRAEVARLRAMVSSVRQTFSMTDVAETVPGAAKLAAPVVPWPAVLGKYLVVGELGQGGQAQVFRALHPALGRDVAIKWSHKAVGPGDSDRLAREGKLLAELDHPGIVRVFDLDVHEGRPFLVMEYVRGCDLAQYATREPIDARRAAELVARLARAVNAAHARGIVHQDIKPANVLMDEAGQPRISDFGIAHLRDLWRKEESPSSGGTLGYMAPEQLGDACAIGPATDTYGLGGVLFFLLTGQAPRKGVENPALAWESVRRGEIDWDRLREKKVPRHLIEICRKALDPDSACRYARAEDMAADLDRYLRQPQVRRRRLGIVAACVAGLALAWGAVALFSKPRPEHDPPVPAPLSRPAFQHLSLRLVRDNREIALQTREDLDRHLPIRGKDKLKLTGTVPANMKVGLFALTLTDPEPGVQELGPLEASNGKVVLPERIPLAGSPATEVLFLCGSADRAPRKEEVTALLAGLPPGHKDLLLLDNVLLSFQSDKVDDSVLLHRVGPLEKDPLRQVVARLDQVRQKLRQKFPFVAGIAFTHAADEPPGPVKRGAIGPNKGTLALVEGGSAEDQKLFRQVMDRLLQTELVRKSYPSHCLWPPRVFIQPRSAKIFNAFAGPMSRDPDSGKLLVRAFISEGYMNKVVAGDPDILAAIMGHELAHVTRGHLGNKITIDLAGLDLSREQEFEADLEGVKIAVAAGFPYRSGVKSAFREWKVLGDRPGFHANMTTHPSWTDRLAMLDKQRPQLWKAMSAFQNGYFFLHAEQYSTAEKCFENVIEDFPDCAEAWANLGYARLMQYCDGLDEKDLRRYGIGPFVAGCFYARPFGLVPIRGDDAMWRKAVKALETALEKDPNLVLARANLGLAYLVHPDEKNPEKALSYFRKAYNQKDKGLDDLNMAALLVNFGVAEQAAGLTKNAAEKFRLARKLLPEVKGLPIRDQLGLALLYNEALVSAASLDPADKARAFIAFEEYLALASPDSAWWALAREQYEKLGMDLGRELLPAEKLSKRFGDNLWRVLTSIEASPGKLITLSDSTREVLKRLGRADRAGVPIFHRSKVKRYYAAAPGLDLLGGDKVLAIFLTSHQAPPVSVQGRGLGTMKHELRVGMPVKEFAAMVKDQPVENRYIDNPSVAYMFLPTMGLGIRTEDGRVSQIVLAQVPRKQGF